jgi:hypothetical protein
MAYELKEQELVKLPQTPLTRVALEQLAKYGGLRALGAIMASRKGIFGIIAIAVSYFLVLGRLPEDAPPELVSRMGEIFGYLVGAISAFFIAGTALEDAAAKSRDSVNAAGK